MFLSLWGRVSSAGEKRALPASRAGQHEAWAGAAAGQGTRCLECRSGWLHYGQYYKSALYPTFRVLDWILVRWAMRKYKELKGH